MQREQGCCQLDLQKTGLYTAEMMTTKFMHLQHQQQHQYNDLDFTLQGMP